MAYAPNWRVQGPQDLLNSKDEIVEYLTKASQHSSKIKLNTGSSFSDIEREARRLALNGLIDERDDDFILMMMLAAAGGIEAVAYFPIQVLDEERKRQTHLMDICEVEALMKEWGRHFLFLKQEGR